MTQRASQKRALILACKELDHVRRPGKLATYLAAQGYEVDVQCFSKDPKVKSDNIKFTEIHHVSPLEILYDKYLRFRSRGENFLSASPTYKAKLATLTAVPFFWLWSLAGLVLRLLSPKLYTHMNAKLIEKLKSSFRRSKNLHFAKEGEALIKASGYKYDLILCHDLYPLSYAVTLKAQHQSRLWLDIVDHPFIRSYMEVNSIKLPSDSERASFLQNTLKSDLILTALSEMPQLDFGELPIEVILNFHSKSTLKPKQPPVLVSSERHNFAMAGSHFRSTGVLRAISFIETYPQACSFDIIGRFIRPAHRAEVLAVIKEKGLDSKVTLRASLPADELRRELLKKTAILVPFDPEHPNLKTILPNRLFDAMRAMVPVIAQKGTATGNWVDAQQVGIATDFYKPDAAGVATQNYLSQADPARRSFCRVNDAFNWETEVRKLDKYL